MPGDIIMMMLGEVMLDLLYLNSSSKDALNDGMHEYLDITVTEEYEQYDDFIILNLEEHDVGSCVFI